MNTLRIGQLAERVGSSVETLRYYESEGLLPAPKRSPAGYRLYSSSDVERASFILRARDMGFSLKEVGELLSLQVDRRESTCGEVKVLAEQKLAAIEQKMRELEKMKAALQLITDACAGGEAPAVECTILNALAS